MLERATELKQNFSKLERLLKSGVMPSRRVGLTMFKSPPELDAIDEHLNNAYPWKYIYQLQAIKRHFSRT